MAVRAGIKQKLVLAGQQGSYYRDVITPLAGKLDLRDKVIFLGRVEPESLPCLYSAADALIFPSLYEGFGLPVLEAMSCGTPVLTSNRSSLAEVAGEAALLVDPGRAESLAVGIREISSQPDLRSELTLRGLERAREFSWERCAQQTVDVYRKALG